MRAGRIIGTICGRIAIRHQIPGVRIEMGMALASCELAQSPNDALRRQIQTTGRSA